MNPIHGLTRTHFGHRHALITPDGHVPSPTPGAEGVTVIAHITPAMGAGFAQATWIVEPAGRISIPATANEHVVYVYSGRGAVVGKGGTDDLAAGDYLYLPPHHPVEIRGGKETARLVVFEKKYVPVPGAEAPAFLHGRAGKIAGQPFLGNPRALLQVLLPDAPAFDLAVNIFTYQPGATLPFVETHVMEHGLVMLEGQGIYRLEDKWYPVAAGDVIWMAPFCPQWFVAIGDVPASYLYYKDVNRPLVAS
jgi:(S)-ureidoglycine aminohydrolase